MEIEAVQGVETKLDLKYKKMENNARSPALFSFPFPFPFSKHALNLVPHLSILEPLLFFTRSLSITVKNSNSGCPSNL